MEEAITTFLDDYGAFSFIVIGQSGSGKTSLVQNLLKNRSDIKYFQPPYECCHIQFTTLVENFITNRTILDYNKKYKRVLLLDDADILINLNRYANKYIQDIIQSKRCKVICTSTNSDEKRLVDIKKISSMYRIPILSDRPYFDKNIYEVVHDIFDREDCPISDLQKAVSSDPVLISYIMYDNFKQYVQNNYDVSNLIKALCYISKMYHDMSILEDNLYTLNDYHIIELSVLCKCYSIRLQQREMSRAQRVRNTDIQYTQIASRSVQQYNIQKKLRNELCLPYEAFCSMAASNNKKKPDTKTNTGAIVSAIKFNFLK